MAIQQPNAVQKNDVEVVFQKSLFNMLDRFRTFKRGRDHLDFLYVLVTTATFYKNNSQGSIREFFHQNFIESQAGKDHAREMLDYLHSMMFEFRLRMRQESDVHYRTLTNHIAASFTENGQGDNSANAVALSQQYSVLPENNQIYPSENASFGRVLEQNGWYLALVLIRLYGMPLIYRFAPPGDVEVEPGKQGTTNGG